MVVGDVVTACRGDESLLNDLWMVMEMGDDGVIPTDVIDEWLGGPGRLDHVRATIETAWGDAGGRAHAPALITDTADGRLVMLDSAGEIIYGLLDEG
jgi:hypothetical protein